MHGENPGQGHLLFFAAGKVERLTIHQMRNLQMLQGFFHAGGDLFSRKAQIFQSKGAHHSRLGDEGMTVLMVEHRVEDVLRISPENAIL